MAHPITSTPSLSTRIRWSLKRRGLLGTLRLALLKPPRALASKLWDRIHRVDTAELSELHSFAIRSENLVHAIRYQATPTGVFRKMIGSLDIRHEDFEFVDFGSGKGRTLLLAAEFAFRGVTGIEFAPELHAIANRNISSFRGPRRCREVRSICIDAADYRLPARDCLLYFNFPFHEPVMQAVLASVTQTIEQSRARVLLVNYEPKPGVTRLLSSSPWFREVKRGSDHVIYESLYCTPESNSKLESGAPR